MAVSDGSAGQVNADLLATCAQVRIAAAIVVGIDAAAVILVAVLLYIQIRMRAKDLTQTPAGVNPAKDAPLADLAAADALTTSYGR